MEPNQDKNPEKRSVRFIEGKGFYIALVLCAAVIGVSAWSLLADTKTMDDERAHSAVLEVVPTPIVPVPETPQPTPELSPEPEIPAEEAAETAAQDVYLWPVDGAVTRAYAMTALAYDETMADWRTHDGIDIAADYGAVVSAMASGTVTQVYHDDRYGTTVVTERADGLRCTYANLESIPTVNVGDSVSAGDTIGSAIPPAANRRRRATCTCRFRSPGRAFRRLIIYRKKIKKVTRNLLTKGALFGTMLLAFSGSRGAHNMAA